MSTSHRLRLLLWRWHKRVGLVCALIVVMLVATGIILNHTSELRLSERGVAQKLLLGWYGIEAASLISVPVAGDWISADGAGTIYYGADKVGQCSGSMQGAVLLSPFIVVACDAELLLLAEDGVYQEQLGEIYGIPTGISRIGVCEAALCLEIDDVISRFDIDALQFSDAQGSPEVQWSAAAVATQTVVSLAALNRRATAERLDWERVLLDLHSGRIAGFAGVLLVDAAALGLLFLALSGFWIWYRSAARVNRQRRQR